ncbi:MAG TPA: hypothetical protein VGW38_29305 [Chloroflexota bacterium]|nr:hypothetical protein [Chloroflexota bacterium]
MRRELETVTPFLQPGVAVIADDVQDNFAFATWTATRPSSLTAVVQQQSKDSLLDISVGT